MKKSLRKGYFYFELNHDYGADTVGAEAAELELNEGIDTFKVKLKPASDGQVHSGRKKARPPRDSLHCVLAPLSKALGIYVQCNKSV